jgi:hypothetical protein
MAPKPRDRGKGAWWIRAVGGDGAVADLGGSQVPDGYGVLGVVIGSLDGASPSAPRDEVSIWGGVDAGLRVGRWSQLAWLAPRHRPRFVSFLANRKQQSNLTSRAGGREVDVTSRQRRKQRRNPARRPWRRPLVGLGLLAGWLAVSKRGRQAVKAAKEQTAKASRKLAAARPARTTTVAPPAGAPPGPVTAEVTKLPHDNDGDDEKSEPKPDTQTETAAAEPPTNQ